MGGHEPVQEGYLSPGAIYYLDGGPEVNGRGSWALAVAMGLSVWLLLEGFAFYVAWMVFLNPLPFSCATPGVCLGPPPRLGPSMVPAVPLGLLLAPVLVGAGMGARQGTWGSVALRWHRLQGTLGILLLAAGAWLYAIALAMTGAAIVAGDGEWYYGYLGFAGVYLRGPQLTLLAGLVGLGLANGLWPRGRVEDPPGPGRDTLRARAMVSLAALVPILLGLAALTPPGNVSFGDASAYGAWSYYSIPPNGLIQAGWFTFILVPLVALVASAVLLVVGGIGAAQKPEGEG